MKYAFFVTASIACGKSTFLQIAHSLGFDTISADEIAHQILDENALDIAKLFSKNILKNNKIDRKILGDLVFSDDKLRIKLQNYMHPKIRERILSQMQLLEARKKIFFVELPLFFESKAYDNLGKSILIYSPKEESLKRLMQRNHLSLEQAQARLKTQMDIEEKVLLADFVIENLSTYEKFRENCVKFIQTISKGEY